MPLPRIEPRLPVRQRNSTHDTHYTKHKALMNRVCRHGRASMRTSVRLTQKKNLSNIHLVFYNNQICSISVWMGITAAISTLWHAMVCNLVEHINTMQKRWYCTYPPNCMLHIAERCDLQILRSENFIFRTSVTILSLAPK